MKNCIFENWQEAINANSDFIRPEWKSKKELAKKLLHTPSWDSSTSLCSHIFYADYDIPAAAI